MSLVLILQQFQLLLVVSGLVVYFYVKLSSEYWTAIQIAEVRGRIQIRKKNFFFRIREAQKVTNPSDPEHWYNAVNYYLNYSSSRTSTTY